MDAPWASLQPCPLPCLCLSQLPAELPLPLQLLIVPLLNGQLLSWGQASKNGSGIHNQGHWELNFKSTLETLK